MTCNVHDCISYTNSSSLFKDKYPAGEAAYLVVEWGRDKYWQIWAFPNAGEAAEPALGSAQICRYLSPPQSTTGIVNYCVTWKFM